MEVLKELSPAAIDSEFRSLAPDAGGSVEWLEGFMEFLLDRLKTNCNYELIQSYLGLFLKVWSTVNVELHRIRFLSPPPSLSPASLQHNPRRATAGVADRTASQRTAENMATFTE